LRLTAGDAGDPCSETCATAEMLPKRTPKINWKNKVRFIFCRTQIESGVMVALNVLRLILS
jgi:hypothetical protein